MDKFQAVIRDGAERPQRNDEIYDHVTNTKVHKDIAFPAMMEIRTGTTPGDKAMFIDTAASNHMVSTGSQLCQHVVNKIDCCMRIRGSCGVTTARTKSTLAFRARNDGGELVPIHPEVLIVPNLGASVFSVVALHEKGVKLDLMANPPVLRDGNSAFPVSTEYPRMFVLRILLNGQDKSRGNMLSHTAVDTDSCHRRMDTCRRRALKQPAEERTTGANDDIDSSGAGKSAVIGYTPAKLRTDETVDHRSAELAIGKGIIQNVNHGSAELVTGKGKYQNVLAGTFIFTKEMTTRTTPETYGIAGTCPTDSRTEGRTVWTMDNPILSTEDTAEDASLSTEDTAEEPSLSSEDTTIFRSATASLSYPNRNAAMGPIYSDFAEHGMGCSATRVVPYLVAAGAPLVD